MNKRLGSIRQIMLASVISVAAAVSLSGCAWFEGNHPDNSAAHMNDYDHDHAPLVHNGDRHDNPITDPVTSDPY